MTPTKRLCTRIYSRKTKPASACKTPAKRCDYCCVNNNTVGSFLKICVDKSRDESQPLYLSILPHSASGRLSSSALLYWSFHVLSGSHRTTQRHGAGTFHEARAGAAQVLAARDWNPVVGTG